MALGLGYGGPFGLGGLVPLVEPRSYIGQPPVVFDFTTDPNGPLPGLWEFVSVADNGSGVKTSTAEPNRDVYYKINTGRGYWNYKRFPALPGVGDEFVERGFMASPAGILFGNNARLEVAFDSPANLIDTRSDEFVFEIFLGYRSGDDLLHFYGARVQAIWASGVWNPSVALDIVVVNGSNPGVVVSGSSVLALENEKPDYWQASAKNGLEVEYRNAVLTATLNGNAQIVYDQAPQFRGAKPILGVRVYNRFGPLISSVPCIQGLSLLQLRDLENLGNPLQISGDLDMSAAALTDYMTLPIQELVSNNYLIRRGPKLFEVVAEVEVEVVDRIFLLSKGSRLITLEEYSTQNLTPCVWDHQYERAKGST